MYVTRPVHPGIGGLGAVKVMVAWSDKHGDSHLPQGLGQSGHSFRINPLPIEQIAGEQYQIRLFCLDQLGQPGGELAPAEYR